jgi:4-diphosphocytidyl-2-C-methyl-D-erythritol kinase
MSVRVFAPAKINLTLQVGRPRADGLHPLQSVVAFAPGAECVEAARADALSLTILGPFAEDVEADETNLVLRAARVLAEAAGIAAPGAALTLYKEYPVASGIGGGSADAAAALRALNALWRLGLREEALAEIGRKLGADVPVCVHAGGAYMTGAGETFTPLALPPLHAVLLNPRQPLPTPSVYRQFDAMNLGGSFVSAGAPSWPDAGAAIAGMRALGNDLVAPAEALMPSLSVLAAAMNADPRALYVSMSGSGATLFALCASRAEACGLEGALAAEHPECWVRAVTLV